MVSSLFDEPVFNEVCRRLARGEPFASITLEENMPTYDVLHTWIKEDSHREQRYVQARLEYADSLAEQIVIIADSPHNINPEYNMWSKLRIDARKWTAAKLRPNRWGDRVINEHSGLNGAPILNEVRYVIHDVTPREAPRTIDHDASPDVPDALVVANPRPPPP